MIIKTVQTTRMVATTSAAERRAAAHDLYNALRVPHHTAVRGKYIVVIDDVFTSGNTLNAVAKRLREAGAIQVTGLTLARAPWR